MKGNKEDYWINYRANGEKGWQNYNSTGGAFLYAYNSLTSRDLDFFGQLQPAQEVTVKKMPAITLCHGSPDKVNEKMLSNLNRTIEILVLGRKDS